MNNLISYKEEVKEKEEVYIDALVNSKVEGIYIEEEFIKFFSER